MLSWMFVYAVESSSMHAEQKYYHGSRYAMHVVKGRNQAVATRCNTILAKNNLQCVLL